MCVCVCVREEERRVRGGGKRESGEGRIELGCIRQNIQRKVDLGVGEGRIGKSYHMDY